MRPEWLNLSIQEKAKFIARQGHAFATADEARVVFQNEGDDDLVDVPSDGKIIGEVVTRGNITMKEVLVCNFHVRPTDCSSISETPRQPG